MATRKVVGQVTPEEKNEIQKLFERRNGLNELAKILTADNAELYEKLFKTLVRLVQSSNLGGTEWVPSINGRALKVATGKSTLILVRFIWLHKTSVT